MTNNKKYNVPTEKHVQHEKNGVPQLESVEPTNNSQSERKEVSADAPITNPESTVQTQRELNVVNYQNQSEKDIETKHQKDFMAELKRNQDSQK